MDNSLPASRRLLNVTSELWSSSEKECAELRAENARLRMDIAAIRDWTLLQDDTVWFSTITTLHDFCEQSLTAAQ